MKVVVERVESVTTRALERRVKSGVDEWSKF